MNNKVGFASSVMFKNNPRFDLIQTVQSALEAKAGSVQLFINDSLMDPLYMFGLINLLASSHMSIILHLPDYPVFISQPQHSQNAATLIEKLPGKDIRVLIHYFEGMTVDQIPVINGKKVSIENAKTRAFYSEEVKAAFNLTREAGVPFVFDPGRIMYINNEATESQGQIEEFILDIIDQMDPSKDILHMSDKTIWGDFRPNACAFPDGISKFMIVPLLQFAKSDGVIIFEHENLEQAIKSLEAFAEA